MYVTPRLRCEAAVHRLISDVFAVLTQQEFATNWQHYLSITASIDSGVKRSSKRSEERQKLATKSILLSLFWLRKRRRLYSSAIDTHCSRGFLSGTPLVPDICLQAVSRATLPRWLYWVRWCINTHIPLSTLYVWVFLLWIRGIIVA